MGLSCLSLPQCLLEIWERAERCQRQQKSPVTLVLTLVWHQGVSEFMAPHISSNIWGLRCTQPGVGGEIRGLEL